MQGTGPPGQSVVKHVTQQTSSQLAQAYLVQLMKTLMLDTTTVLQICAVVRNSIRRLNHFETADIIKSRTFS